MICAGFTEPQEDLTFVVLRADLYGDTRCVVWYQGLLRVGTGRESMI